MVLKYKVGSDVCLQVGVMSEILMCIVFHGD